MDDAKPKLVDLLRYSAQTDSAELRHLIRVGAKSLWLWIPMHAYDESYLTLVDFKEDYKFYMPLLSFFAYTYDVLNRGINVVMAMEKVMKLDQDDDPIGKRRPNEYGA